MQWFGARGVIYRVMASADLTDWEPLDGTLIIGRNAETGTTAPAAAARMFYRVDVVR